MVIDRDQQFNMALQIKRLLRWGAFFSILIVGLSGLSSNATAQEVPIDTESVLTVEESELTVSDIRAFGLGTNTNVHSVELLDPTEFNGLLLTSHQREAIWSHDPLWVGLQFLQYIQQPITGSQQHVAVTIPGEWEPGLEFDFARVEITDQGWLSDAIVGERYVIWIIQGETGEFVIQRALRANLCQRPFQEFYSMQDCP